MKSRIFETSNGYKLNIKSRKSAVIFEIEEVQESKHYRYFMEFTLKGFEELKAYLEEISNKSWSNFTPKEAISFGADYYEYYDKEFDNNGYLSIRDDGLLIKRPSLESKKLYKFNKRKMESFIYDLRNLVAV